jgi:hypothetical protein
MTDSPYRARAGAAFRTVTPEENQTAMEEYRAKQRAELDKAARLKGDAVSKGSRAIICGRWRLAPFAVVRHDPIW